MILSTAKAGMLFGEDLGQATGAQYPPCPLADLLVVGAGLDAGLVRLPAGRVRALATAACLIGVVPFSVFNRPARDVVPFNRWEIQSQSGPLLRHLRGLDPDKTWLVDVKRSHRFAYAAMEFYRPYGYRFRRAAPGETPDIVLAPIRLPRFSPPPEPRE